MTKQLTIIEQYLNQEQDSEKWRIFSDSMSKVFGIAPFASGTRAAGFVAQLADLVPQDQLNEFIDQLKADGLY